MTCSIAVVGPSSCDNVSQCDRAVTDADDIALAMCTVCGDAMTEAVPLRQLLVTGLVPRPVLIRVSLEASAAGMHAAACAAVGLPPALCYSVLPRDGFCTRSFARVELRGRLLAGSSLQQSGAGA